MITEFSSNAVTCQILSFISIKLNLQETEEWRLSTAQESDLTNTERDLFLKFSFAVFEEKNVDQSIWILSFNARLKHPTHAAFTAGLFCKQSDCKTLVPLWHLSSTLYNRLHYGTVKQISCLLFSSVSAEVNKTGILCINQSKKVSESLFFQLVQLLGEHKHWLNGVQGWSQIKEQSHVVALNKKWIYSRKSCGLQCPNDLHWDDCTSEVSGAYRATYCPQPETKNYQPCGAAGGCDWVT